MKKIGFIDLYISEWHANNYPAWIKRANEELGFDFQVSYAWAEQDVSPVDGRTTDEWCQAFGVEKCDTIEEICEKSDYVLILAPSNPEVHLKYAEIALRYGKNTYIDKTFAPDAETARKIFAIAEQYGTKFFTSSALRYCDELTEFDGICTAATTFGCGSNVTEYIIHQTEMLVKLMGTGASRVRSERADGQYFFRVEYADGRKGNILFNEVYGMPVGFIPSAKDKNCAYVPVTSDYFKNLIASILTFYQTGVLPFDGAQTLEVMKVREALVKAKDADGQWVNV